MRIQVQSLNSHRKFRALYRDCDVDASFGAGHPMGGGSKTVKVRGPKSLLWNCVFCMWQASDTHEISPTWLPKHDLSKDDISGHAKVDRDWPQPYTKSCRQPWNAEGGRKSSPRKNTPIGYWIPNDQPWEHTHENKEVYMGEGLERGKGEMTYYFKK